YRRWLLRRVQGDRPPGGDGPQVTDRNRAYRDTGAHAAPFGDRRRTSVAAVLEVDPVLVGPAGMYVGVDVAVRCAGADAPLPSFEGRVVGVCRRTAGRVWSLVLLGNGGNIPIHVIGTAALIPVIGQAVSGHLCRLYRGRARTAS